MPYLCLQQEGVPSYPALIEEASKKGFTVVSVPINCCDLPLEFETAASLADRQSENTYSDLLLPPEKWDSKTILLLTDSIDCDSTDPAVRKHSEHVLLRDIAWAEYLQTRGFTMVRLKSGHNMNLAHIATKAIKGSLLVQVPLYNPRVAQAVQRSDIEPEALDGLQTIDTWHWWNQFRWAADFNAKVKVVLELHEDDLPADEVVRRWLGEPIEALIIPSTMFIRNRHNYPVLPKAWQSVVADFLNLHVNIIVATTVQDQSIGLYAEYLTNFVQLHSAKHDLKSYEDVLENPLQPLYDNLDCYTYDIFEKDPVKYRQYQTAIEEALVDRVPSAEIDQKLIVIMVLGAGRGPLVRAALNAAENTKRKIRVYIIEKNPNAIRTLKAISRKMWADKDVHLFSKDMREFSPPEKADILVSELLGSFGDNELSPECLDCAQNLLKADGISIPCKSISYINPIMSSKLYNAVRHVIRHEPQTRDRPAPYRSHAEAGFVVLLKNVYNIGRPLPLFEFVHPNREAIVDNSRYKFLRFEVAIDCVLTGIAGYFEAVLYKDVEISINPPTHTQGMPSWFPMYFPFTDPLNVRQGDTIEIHFWRCATKQKVWYEWCLATPTASHIHNHGGRSYPIYCA